MSDTDSMARDVRAGYIAWCRGEVPARMVGEHFDQFIARIKAEAWDEGWCTAAEAAPGDVWFPAWDHQANPYREEER